MDKKVTIIIPVYNCGRDLLRCTNSLLAQTSKDFEVLLINDGSTDNSLDVIKDVCNAHPDVFRYLTHENIGVSRTRNLGIQKVSTPYIMFADNDDFMDADYVQKHIDAIESAPGNAPFDIAVSGYRRVKGENGTTKKNVEDAELNDANKNAEGVKSSNARKNVEGAKLDKANKNTEGAELDSASESQKVMFEMRMRDDAWSPYRCNAPWAHIYRTDFLKHNNLEFFDNNIGEDVYFNFAALTKTKRVLSIDYVGYNWCFNTESISNTSQRGMSKNINVKGLLDALWSVCESSAASQPSTTSQPSATSRLSTTSHLSAAQQLSAISSYFFMRYVVWYILFSGRSASPKRFIECEGELFKWLDEHNLNTRPLIFSRAIASEPLLYRVSVWGYYYVHKFHLRRLFAHIYCKGKDE